MCANEIICVLSSASLFAFCYNYTLKTMTAFHTTANITDMAFPLLSISL